MIPKTIKSCSTPSELGKFMRAQRQRITAPRSIGGLRWMRAYADLVDVAIDCLFSLAIHDTACELGKLEADALEKICLVATGGYGRQELSPFSDIDIAFVVADSDDPRVDLLVKRTYHLLMDVLLDTVGLKIAYAYRELGKLQGLPLDTQTALLDARRITGSQILFRQFQTEVCNTIAPAAFVLQHVDARRSAAEHWGNTPYASAPHIKEGKGGLRDLQTARWIAQVVFEVPRNEVWHALRSRGILSDEEIKWACNALSFLAKVRNTLHVVCGYPNEMLSPDRQEQVASLRKIKSSYALMRAYYRHAERITAIYDKVVAACLREPLELEPGIVAQFGQLKVLDCSLFSRDDEVAIRIFEYAMAYHLDIAWETVDLLRMYIRKLRCRSNSTPERLATRAFLRVLSHRNAGDALSSMLRVGVLQWQIPEFESLMYQPPGDIAHKLTVGAHSLETVRQLANLTNDNNRELSEIWTNLRQPELLVLAAFLHDIGKSSEKVPHAEAGAATARAIAQRLGLSENSADKVEFLVRNHLLMSKTARLRDLNQKRTIEDFVAVVNSHDLLDMLYLLTVADMKSVGQIGWTDVQLRFLHELYQRAVRLLKQSTVQPADIERHRSRLAQELSLASIPEKEIHEHCRAMPAAYLLNTPLDDIASHISYVRQACSGKPVVRIRDDTAAAFTEITVCVADDSPGLLARITGVLAAMGINIHAAQIFTRASADRIAIDILYVDFEGRILTPTKQFQTKAELEQALVSKSNPDLLWAQYGRQPAAVINLISLDVASHLSDDHTVIEVVAEDNIGLLYRLTSAISSLGWSIHSARISTWGHRAHDAFYVTDAYGTKLNEETAKTALLEILSKS